MTIAEFKQLMTFYTTSTLFTEETKHALIDNLYKHVTKGE